jgi:hypothetical protein
MKSYSRRGSEDNGVSGPSAPSRALALLASPAASMRPEKGAPRSTSRTSNEANEDAALVELSDMPMDEPLHNLIVF